LKRIKFLFFIFLLFLYGERIGASPFTLVSVPYYSIEGYPLASCVSMVLDYYGIKVDQKELKEKIIAPGGEDPIALLEYVKSKGLKGYIVQLQLKELKNIIEHAEIPVIVAQSFRIPYDYYSYWRVVIGIDEKGIVTNDPIIRNNYILDEKRFNSLWVRETNNIAIIILPKDKNLSVIESTLVKGIITSYTNARKAISKSDWKSAKVELENFLKLSPENPLGLNAYAYVVLQAGDIENAKKTIEKAIAKAPLYYIYDTAGLIYWKGNEIDKAENYFSKAYSLSPSSKEIVINYANFLISQNKKNEAIDILKSFLLINPEDKDIKSLLDKLNQ